MSEKKVRHKPTGITGPIELGPHGPIRHQVEFPTTKEEIEFFIAKGFCNPGHSGYLPHLKRYSHFQDLQQQQENSLDFQVNTGLGHRWLELCEFSPLEHLGGKYELVTDQWDGRRMLDLFLMVVAKKEVVPLAVGIRLVAG